MSKYNEKDVFIVAKLRGKPVYINDVFSQVSVQENKPIDHIEKDGLRCHFVSNASLGVLNLLRERRDEIKENNEVGAETIKIYSEPEITRCSGIFIDNKGNVELLTDQEIGLPVGFGDLDSF